MGEREAEEFYLRELRRGYRPPRLTRKPCESPVEQVDRELGAGGYSYSRDFVNLTDNPVRIMGPSYEHLKPRASIGVHQLTGKIGGFDIKLVYLDSQEGVGVVGQVRAKTRRGLKRAVRFIEAVRDFDEVAGQLARSIAAKMSPE